MSELDSLIAELAEAVIDSRRWHVGSFASNLFQRAHEQIVADAAARVDAERLDWLSAWRRGDITICPPWHHGGDENNWLVSRAIYEGAGVEPAGEWEGTSLRAAIDAARAASGPTGAM